jgi:hypothetical protein
LKYNKFFRVKTLKPNIAIVEKAIIFLEYRTKKQPLKERLFDFIQLKLGQGLVQDLQLSRQCVQYQLINAQGLR